MASISTGRLKAILLPVATLPVVIAVWALAVAMTHVSPIIVPSPLDVLTAARRNVGVLMTETAITMAESVVGFVLGGIVAYGLAILFVQLSWAEKAAMPYAIALKSTPLIALAPLLVMWCGTGFLSKVVMSALVAFWPILVAGLAGLKMVDPDAMALMTSLAANRRQVLFKLRIPGSLPYLFSAMRVSSSLAVVGAIIAELVGSSRGIGHFINQSSYYLETPVLFAAVGCISGAAIGFYALIVYIESVVLFWQPRGIQ